MRATQKSIRLGTAAELPTKAKPSGWRRPIRENIARASQSATGGELTSLYKAEDMSKRRSTASALVSQLNRIEARWRETPVREMLADLIGIEQWINGMQKRRGPGPLAKNSKLHVTAIFHTLIESAMRRHLIEVQRDPIQLIRVTGPARGVRPIVTITIEDYKRLLESGNLPLHVKTMVEVAMCLGLRISEILGLRWEDVDLVHGTVTISRSVVGAHQDETKTPESAETLPLHPC